MKVEKTSKAIQAEMDKQQARMEAFIQGVKDATSDDSAPFNAGLYIELVLQESYNAGIEFGIRKRFMEDEKGHSNE